MERRAGESVKSHDWSNGVAVACESVTVLGESLVRLAGSLVASC